MDIENGAGERIPLFPIQLHTLGRPDKDPHIFNLTYLGVTRYPFDLEILCRALWYVIEHHEALRLRFLHTASGWQAFIARDNGPAPLSYIDLSVLEKDQQSSTIEALAAQFQSTLNLSEGPIIRVVYFDLGNRQAHRMLFMVHHLAFDAFSWPILMSDFFTAYKQLQHHQPVHLPPTTTSLKEYTRTLAAYAHSPALREELAYWTAEPRRQIAPLPVDYPAGLQQPALYRTVQGMLNEKETRALIALAKQRITIHDLLLTALYQTYERWTGKRTTLIEVFQHGRLPLFASIDLTRTIGYVAVRFPFLLDGSHAQDLRELTHAIREQYRRVPGGGIGYGVLRYSGDSATQQLLSQFPTPQWTLNYRGRAISEGFMKTNLHDRPLSQAQEQVRNTVSQRRIDARYLSIIGGINGQQLQISLQYQENLHKRSTIEMLMHYLVESLRELQHVL